MTSTCCSGKHLSSRTMILSAHCGSARQQLRRRASHTASKIIRQQPFCHLFDHPTENYKGVCAHAPSPPCQLCLNSIWLNTLARIHSWPQRLQGTWIWRFVVVNQQFILFVDEVTFCTAQLAFGFCCSAFGWNECALGYCACIFSIWSRLPAACLFFVSVACTKKASYVSIAIR